MHFVSDLAGVPDDLPFAVLDCGVLVVVDELLVEADALSAPSFAPGSGRASELGDCSPVSLSALSEAQLGCTSCLLSALRTLS